MAAFNSSRFYSTELTDLYGVVSDTRDHFLARGYEVNVEDSAYGSFISLSKGGIFKSILGMKTALNVEINSVPGGIQAEAKVGIWAQQAIPTMIMLFVTWPVLLTQITGLVQQAKLDDEVLEVIGQAIEKHESADSYSSDTQFCICCGEKLPVGSAFCPRCGGRQ